MANPALSNLEDALTKINPIRDLEDGDPQIKTSLDELNAHILRTFYAEEIANTPVEKLQAILSETDALLTALCNKVGNPPLLGVASQNIISTKQYGLGDTIEESQNILLTVLENEMSGVERVQAMVNAGYLPSEWSATYRPSQEHTNFLSRFTPEYKHDDIGRLLHSFPPSDVRDALLAVVEARFEMRQYQIWAPRAFAVGEDVVAVASAGLKERIGILDTFAINKRDATAQSSTSPGMSQEQRYPAGQMMSGVIQAGLVGPAVGLAVMPDLIWVSGDSRIKAFDVNTGGLRHTLNTSGHEGRMGITEDVVLHLSDGIWLTLWNRRDLETHDPVYYGLTKGADLLGGKLKGHGDDIRLLDEEDRDEIEMSAGSKAHVRHKISGLKGTPIALAPCPGSSKFIFSLGGYGSESYGVRMLDLQRPDASPQLVGIGLPLPPVSISTHQLYSDMYVTAGGDQVARIWDLRQPLPQLVLDRHGATVTSCAIAPFGMSTPIIFTAGHDELIKTWDIRHTKSCLYEFSTGCLEIEAIQWHDRTNSLFATGTSGCVDRLGDQHGFERIQRKPRDYERREDAMSEDGSGYESGEDDDSLFYACAGEELEEATYWPKECFVDPDNFGKRWCATNHALLEYRFTPHASPDSRPRYIVPVVETEDEEIDEW